MTRTNILISLLLLICSFCYSQTYTFSNREEAISYTDSQGSNKFKTISNKTGVYKIKFEMGDGGKTKLFTIYNDGVEDEWFGILEKFGNVEMQGVIYSKAKYGATKSNEIVTVLSAIDQSGFLIIFPDKIIHYLK